MTTTTLNSLARASSAYLRSAMHQPIQWHEWGEEAFAAAQRENKPVLLDIGAVWGHWCHVMDRESFAGRSGRVSASIIEAVKKSAFSMFDAHHGGFGQAPKFPHPPALDLLIEQYARTASGASLRRAAEGGRPHMDRARSDTAQNEEDLRNLIVTTLEHMANGGVYDQLAGGFHRYSVDERWVVPHFEKMCFDNSELP